MVTYEKQWQLARDAKAVRRVPIGGALSFPEGVGGRKLLMWGLGEDAKRIFEYFDWSLWDEKLYGFVEKDRDMAGKIFIGREIFHPTDVEMHARSPITICSGSLVLTQLLIISLTILHGSTSAFSLYSESKSESDFVAVLLCDQ